jgi:hypothetical protein
MIRTDRAGAYASILKGLYETHPYVRRYVIAVMQGPFVAPVVTSAKQHVSPKYRTAKALADDVAEGKFDLASLLELIANRIGRPLSADERSEIEKGVSDLVSKLRSAAAAEPQTEFERKMLNAINEIAVPAVLRREGLGFDFNSLRRLWLMGTEFQISWATSAHPKHDGWLTFETATVQLSEQQDKIDGIRFDRGVRGMAEGFLDRLFEPIRSCKLGGSHQSLPHGSCVPRFASRPGVRQASSIISFVRITAGPTSIELRRTFRRVANLHTKKD